MKRKKFKLIFVAATAVIIAGIAAGTVVRLMARDRANYRAKIAAGEEKVWFDGKKLSHVTLTGMNAILYADMRVYESSDGQQYYFDGDTQELRSIHNKSPEEGMRFTNPEAMQDNAKEIIGKWFEGNEAETFIWQCRTDNTGFTDVDLYQLVNDDIKIWLGGVTYDQDGVYSGAFFNFDAMVDSAEIGETVSEAEAIERAKTYLEENYGETGWSEITAQVVTSRESGIHWDVTCKKYGRIITGYTIAVDVFTGEARYEDMLK